MGGTLFSSPVFIRLLAALLPSPLTRQRVPAAAALSDRGGGGGAPPAAPAASLRGPRTPGLGRLPPPRHCTARRCSPLPSPPLGGGVRSFRAGTRGRGEVESPADPRRPRCWGGWHRRLSRRDTPPTPFPVPSGGRLGGERGGSRQVGQGRAAPPGAAAAGAGTGAGGTRRRRQPKAGLCLPPEGEGSHARQLRRRESRGLGCAPHARVVPEWWGRRAPALGRWWGKVFRVRS